MHLNAQSLSCHLDEIEILINENNLDVLCVSETWIDPNTSDRFVSIPNFKIFRNDHGRGGGVCIYVSSDLSATPINMNKENVDGIEDIWLTIQCRKLPSIIVACIYRHPKTTAKNFEYLLDCLRNICLKNKPVLILGDINDDQLNSNSKLSKIIKMTKFTQLIDKPTRITDHSSTLLDVIITNKPDLIINSSVAPSPIADHELISVTINIEKPKRKPQVRTFRCLKNYNLNKFCDLLLNETTILNSIFNTDDVNTQVNTFNDVFIKCLDNCAPLVTKEISRPFAPWLNSETKQAINKRNDLQKEVKNNRANIELHELYKTEKKRIRLLIKKCKTDYFKDKFNNCEGDIAATWKVVNDLIPKAKSDKHLPNFEDDLKKAEEFNDFFVNMGKNAYENSQENIERGNDYFALHSNLDENISINFRPHPVDMETIILVIKDLNNTSSYGCDGIPLCFIRDSLSTLIIYITVIVNTSIVTGKYPSIWKYPYINPVFKGGDRDDVNNYRPISLLPILSKILEKIVAIQLMSYLETNNLLSNSQHGFRSNLSTETALLKITDEIYHNIDSKKVSLLLLLDLSKAFDSVHHDILIHKCKKLGIDEFWFQDYLCNRTQSVRINNAISSPKKITFGVPQGSILGPILFIIFINDMSNTLINCFIVQYADDTQILLTGNIDDIAELIVRAEHILSKAKIYFQLNGLSVNERKTQCIFFGSRQNISRISEDVRISFNNNDIGLSKKVKNLGVYMDSFMVFDAHIEEMSKKVTGTLLYINRISDKFDRSTRITVVQSLVLSIMYYCSKVWGKTNKTMIERVQKLLNFAAKVAYGGLRKYDHVSPIFNELGWLKVDQKIFFDLCIAVFKTIKNQTPSWVFSLPSNSSVREINTRQNNDLFIPRTTTDVGARSFLVKGPTLWNTLPKEITDIQSINIFKTKLKHFILHK